VESVDALDVVNFLLDPDLDLTKRRVGFLSFCLLHALTISFLNVLKYPTPGRDGERGKRLNCRKHEVQSSPSKCVSKLADIKNKNK
jgi:hypothetical protein